MYIFNAKMMCTIDPADRTMNVIPLTALISKTEHIALSQNLIIQHIESGGRFNIIKIREQLDLDEKGTQDGQDR